MMRAGQGAGSLLHAAGLMHDPKQRLGLLQSAARELGSLSL